MGLTYKTLWINKKNQLMYTLISEGLDSETNEKVIVYMSGNGQIWVRPFKLFFEKFEQFNQ